MRVVVVYESLFGNTREIAEAVAEGARQADAGALVNCLPIAEADPELIQDVDLLVVGGPTHMRGMTSAFTRKMGLQAERKKATVGGHAPEAGAEGPGVRDWLHEQPAPRPGIRAAAFDTRADARLAGGAAQGIARRLRHLGYVMVAEPEGYIIEDTEGPLRDGEEARATAWGTEVYRRSLR